MISITLNCGSVNELHQALREILNGEPSTRPYVGLDLAMQGADKTVKQIVDVAITPEQHEAYKNAMSEAQPAPQEKKTRSRKPKAEKSEEVNEAVAESPFETKQHDAKAEEPTVVQPQVNNDDAIPTKEKVHQALQQVNVAVNLTKAREILAKYKVQRISEVQPSQYQAFIDDCNAAVAMS